MGRAVFTGAATPHPTSVLLNPAALGLTLPDVSELSLGFFGTLDYYSIDQDHLQLDGSLASGDAVKGADPGYGAALTYIAHPGRTTIAIDFHMPPQETFPQDHESLRYSTLGQRQRDFLSSIAAAFKISGRFYAGVTLSHHNTFLRFKYARDTAAEAGTGPNGINSDCGGAPCGYENPAASERYDVNVNSPYISTSNLKFSLGFLVRLYNEVWLGVSYHSPPGFNIQTELEGNVHIDRAPRDGGERLTGDSIVDTSYPASVDAEVTAQLPQFLELHIGGRWEDLSRLQAYDVRMIGSTIVPSNVPEWQLRTRGMHDAVAFWGGVEQRDYGQRYRFGARVGFETSSTLPERTTPTTIAPNSFTADVGGQLRIGSWIAQLTAGVQVYEKVDVSNSAFDPRFISECMAEDFNYATKACEAVRNGYAVATGAGDYFRISSIVRLGFRYELP